MKVNSNKTEFCIFHKNNVQQKTIVLDNVPIKSNTQIKVLGLTFDSKLNWHNHITSTIQKCNKTLQAIRLISKYFSIDEKLNIVTSLFYSKLYYGAEVWLLPTLSFSLKKKLLNLSTRALRLVANDHYRIFNSNDLHCMFKRFTPNQWKIYSNLQIIYRIINYKIPNDIWIELQFNALPLTRANKTIFPPVNKLKIGNNSIINRLSFASTLINNDDLNLSYESFKVKIKCIVLLQP